MNRWRQKARSVTLGLHGADEFYASKGKQVRVKGYRRLHIAINEHQEIVACELTTIHGDEASGQALPIGAHCTY